MDKITLKNKALSVLLALTLSLLISTPVFAYSLLGGKWPSSTIYIGIDSNVPFLGYSGAIDTAQTWWDSKTDVSLPSSSGSGHIHINAYNYGYTPWDGETNFTSYTSFYKTYYSDAQVKLNRYYTDGYVSSNQLRLTLVTTHEIGHALGLAHNLITVPNPNMMYQNDVWQAYLMYNSLKYGPTVDDISGVNSLY